MDYQSVWLEIKEDFFSQTDKSKYPEYTARDLERLFEFFSQEANNAFPNETSPDQQCRAEYNVWRIIWSEKEAPPFPGVIPAGLEVDIWMNPPSYLENEDIWSTLATVGITNENEGTEDEDKQELFAASGVNHNTKHDWSIGLYNDGCPNCYARDHKEFECRKTCQQCSGPHTISDCHMSQNSEWGKEALKTEEPDVEDEVKMLKERIRELEDEVALLKTTNTVPKAVVIKRERDDDGYDGYDGYDGHDAESHKRVKMESGYDT
ncbi:uncharacterized protein LY89DRAFT_717078 [Mollisia scopiformis]|uniref:Uncharacterized protein n=1 Tax=Mollisia scopiformis TaxID=149040 RepID=A0A194XHC4_MOLSC|nr:uncharacterized protein LY89DRAFT_717078 [Mollisia scopiformis]KUJ19610.1 hypothetical protein LY89DRAFT_717078 [Mollisia scopiformis]